MKPIFKFILLILFLLFDVFVFAGNIKQQPDSLNNSDESISFSPFKEELIIETKNYDDTATEKLIVEKQRERAVQYIPKPIVNRWDTLEFSDINIDSIDFIFTENIYEDNYLINFLEQIEIFKPKNIKLEKKINNSNKNKAQKKSVLKKEKKIHKQLESKLEHFPNEWSFSIIIVILLLLLMIRFYKQRSLRTLFMSMVNYQVALKNFKENNSLSIKINVIITSIFIINISFFLTLSCYELNYFPFNTNGILLFIYMLIMVLLFYLIKYIAYRILAFIFNIMNEVKEFYYNTFIFNKVLGIILIPLSIILPFVKLHNVIYLYKFVIFLIIIFLIWKLLYSIYIAFRLKLSILYLILYLCALEILPAIAVIKFLSL